MFNVNPKMKDLRDEMNKLNAEAAEMVRDQAWLNEVSAEIGEAIYYGFENNNMVDLFTDVKRVNRGETITAGGETRGLEAFHVSRGGYIEESTLHSEIDFVKPDQIGIHVTEHLDRLEVNFATTAQKLIELAPKRIDAEINRRVFSTMKLAVPSSSAYYIAANNMSLSVLSSAIAGVEDEIETDAGAPVIVARPAMIRKIRDALTAQNAYSLFLPETNEDLLRRGQVATYQGTPVLTLRDYRDEFGRSYFPNNELWVVGRDVATTGFWGAPRVNNWITQGEEYWHYSIRTDYGVTVTRPSHVRRIVDSSLSA